MSGPGNFQGKMGHDDVENGVELVEQFSPSAKRRNSVRKVDAFQTDEHGLNRSFTNGRQLSKIVASVETMVLCCRLVLTLMWGLYNTVEFISIASFENSPSRRSFSFYRDPSESVLGCALVPKDFSRGLQGNYNPQLYVFSSSLVLVRS